jgi:hypothetical protein
MYRQCLLKSAHLMKWGWETQFERERERNVHGIATEALEKVRLILLEPIR